MTIFFALIRFNSVLSFLISGPQNSSVVSFVYAKPLKTVSRNLQKAMLQTQLETSRIYNTCIVIPKGQWKMEVQPCAYVVLLLLP